MDFSAIEHIIKLKHRSVQNDMDSCHTAKRPSPKEGGLFFYPILNDSSILQTSGLNIEMENKL